MSISNRIPQQDAREHLENQVREQHERRTTAEGTALDSALSAGDLLLAVIERYRKKDFGGKTALYERTCGSARTGREYVFLAKHRDLLEEKPADSAGFDGRSIMSALAYIRERKRTPESEAETPTTTPTPADPTATSSSPQPMLATRDDVGADSRSEVDRLHTRIEEQGHEIRRLKELVARLEDRLEDPTPTQLQVQIEKLGLSRFRQEVLPRDWVSSLTNTALSLATLEKLIATLEHKIPSSNKAARKHLHTLKEAAIDRPPTIAGTYVTVLH
jgi:hypothetical protein